LKTGAGGNFAIVDAAMNDQMRPALYGAWMDVQPVTARTRPLRTYDVVGPVCESGDWLARERALAIEAGDLLAMMSAGAYGMSMASTYNSRCRAAEVIVDGQQAHCVRRRESIDDLMAGESALP
jgi:diaminopimelate decarboxylase